MDKSKLKVGEQVFIAPYGSNARRMGYTPRHVTITKVGNKYAYVGENSNDKFEIATGVQDNGQYQSNFKAYHTREEWELEKGRKMIANELSNVSWATIPYDVLTQVIQLITPKQ